MCIHPHPVRFFVPAGVLFFQPFILFCPVLSSVVWLWQMVRLRIPRTVLATCCFLKHFLSPNTHSSLHLPPPHHQWMPQPNSLTVEISICPLGCCVWERERKRVLSKIAIKCLMYADSAGVFFLRSKARAGHFAGRWRIEGFYSLSIFINFIQIFNYIISWNNFFPFFCVLPFPGVFHHPRCVVSKCWWGMNGWWSLLYAKYDVYINLPASCIQSVSSFSNHGLLQPSHQQNIYISLILLFFPSAIW